MYTFSIKSCYSYLNIFSILPPIIALYRLTIATHYGHLYIKYIEITYNITYKGSLYFAIPGVIGIPKGVARIKSCTWCHSHNCGVEMYKKGNSYYIWKVHTECGV